MCDYGPCTAPNTVCPHWQGTFCELDMSEWSITTIHIEGGTKLSSIDYVVNDNFRRREINLYHEL